MRCCSLLMLVCCRPKGFCFVTRFIGFCFVPRYDLLFACAFVCFYLNRPKRLLLSLDIKLAFILFRVTYLFVVCIGLCLLLFQQGWPKGFCCSLRTRWLFAYTLICFLFEQAQKASALLRVCNLLLFVPFTYFYIPFIVFILSRP